MLEIFYNIFVPLFGGLYFNQIFNFFECAGIRKKLEVKKLIFFGKKLHTWNRSKNNFKL